MLMYATYADELEDQTEFEECVRHHAILRSDLRAS
jgi:hypothetical protein